MRITETDYSPQITEEMIDHLVEYFDDVDREGYKKDELRDRLLDEGSEVLLECIDHMVIYYSDCAKIVQRLGYWDWSENELGIDVKNITDAAICALYTYAMEHGIVADAVEEYLK